MAEWDYDGACAPSSPTVAGRTFETFTLGVFPLVPTSNGKGTKRGKVRYRVRGLVADSYRCHQVAGRLAWLLTNGADVEALKLPKVFDADGRHGLAIDEVFEVANG